MDTALITKGVIMPHWPTGAITTLLCIFFLLPPSFTSLHGMLRTSAKDHYPLRFNDDVQVSDELCGEICKPVIDIKKIEDLLNEVRYLDTERLLFGKSVAYHLAEPLKKAICTNNLRILDSLVLAGGDVDDGLIHTARNNLAAIRYLLAHGADIIPPVKRTPSDIVTMLLARHLTNRPYTFNMDGDTVLYQATRNKNLEVMQVLLAYSAQLTDKKEEIWQHPPYVAKG